MPFVAANPSPATTEASIDPGAFWPAIVPGLMRDQMRIDGTIPAPRLRSALIEAAASVNGELASWRQSRQDAGRVALEDVPAEEVDGTSILVHRYLRAVGCLAKASLLERLGDYDATGKAMSTSQAADKAAALNAHVDDLQRDARHAIAAIQGRSGSVVELI